MCPKGICLLQSGLFYDLSRRNRWLLSIYLNCRSSYLCHVFMFIKVGHHPSTRWMTMATDVGIIDGSYQCWSQLLGTSCFVGLCFACHIQERRHYKNLCIIVWWWPCHLSVAVPMWITNCLPWSNQQLPLAALCYHVASEWAIRWVDPFTGILKKFSTIGGMGPLESKPICHMGGALWWASTPFVCQFHPFSWHANHFAIEC